MYILYYHSRKYFTVEHHSEQVVKHSVQYSFPLVFPVHKLLTSTLHKVPRSSICYIQCKSKIERVLHFTVRNENGVIYRDSLLQSTEFSFTMTTATKYGGFQVVQPSKTVLSTL